MADWMIDRSGHQHVCAVVPVLIPLAFRMNKYLRMRR